MPCEPVRVLLVDDNEGMLSLATRVLRNSCVIVGAVSDGEAAVEVADLLRPHVIVLDISMNGMSGLQTASALRQAGSVAAVVFLTIHDEDEFVAAARAAGGTGYVLKPRLVSDLIIAVHEAREGRRFESPRDCWPRPATRPLPTA
jgi:DNA-binding NarL/FixJ family response regulator